MTALLIILAVTVLAAATWVAMRRKNDDDPPVERDSVGVSPIGWPARYDEAITARQIDDVNEADPDPLSPFGTPVSTPRRPSASPARSSWGSRSSGFTPVPVAGDWDGDGLPDTVDFSPFSYGGVLPDVDGDRYDGDDVGRDVNPQDNGGSNIDDVGGGDFGSPDPAPSPDPTPASDFAPSPDPSPAPDTSSDSGYGGHQDYGSGSAPGYGGDYGSGSSSGSDYGGSSGSDYGSSGGGYDSGGSSGGDSGGGGF
jgi:hypothetical protein